LRSAIAAAIPLHRPGSPSLARRHSNPRAWRALPRRPVLRDPPTSAGPSAFVLSSSGLPANPAGTQQISRGKTLRFRGDHVANTPPAPTGTGHRRRRPAHPPKGRLTALHSRSPPPRIYGFFQTRPHGSPPANQPPADRPVNSEPRPCLIDVGFPLSGPQYRTHTSDLNVMPGTPALRPTGSAPQPRYPPASSQGGAFSTGATGCTFNRP
jgi:hypothetical protein